MIPLVDLHCHLLAGLDDGPVTEEDAVAMCRIAYDSGTRLVAALAHQNERWPLVTPERIRQAGRQLVQNLRDREIPLEIFPSAEVMICPGIESFWQRGDFLSLADGGKYLLVEAPHGLALDWSDVCGRLLQAGVRPVLAHPERQPELLHEPGRIERLVGIGCLVQVSADSVTRPCSGRDERALKSWFQRGIVHVLGSDGHSPRERPPRMADAYLRIARWAGALVADRICSTQGMVLLHGLPLPFSQPLPPPRPRRWFPRLW